MQRMGTGAAQWFRSPRGRKRTERLLQALYFAAFAALAAMLFCRCRYGYASPDETFYLLTPYRFLRGDRMLLDEWHFSQFSSFTLMPGLWLYQLLAGSTEGILLHFRYIFTAVWCVFSLFLYAQARKLHEHGARCASLMLLGYAPYGIMALSYNSLGILYLTCAALFLLCPGRHPKMRVTLSGVFFACAVLCCPYLALVYLGYSLALGFHRLRKKNPVIPTTEITASACWKYFTLGALLLAALFLLFLLSGGSPAQIMASFSHAMQDEEHANFSLVSKTWEYFYSLLHSNAYFLPLLAALVLLTLLTLRRRHPLWLCLLCAALVLYLRRFMTEEPYLNYLMLPLTFGGVYAAAVSRNQTVRRIFLLWLLPGILYTFCLHYSSNMVFYAISSAATVSSLAGMLMLWMVCDEVKEAADAGRSGRLFRLAASAALILCFAFQMRYEVPLRYQSVFQEPGLMAQEDRTEIRQGPLAGIITSPEHAEKYSLLLEDIQGISHQKVLYLYEENWLYLTGDNEMAAFSGWLGSINSGWITAVNPVTLERLSDFYALRPEKQPEIIFCGQENAEPVLVHFQRMGLRLRQLADGNCLISCESPPSP